MSLRHMAMEDTDSRRDHLRRTTCTFNALIQYDNISRNVQANIRVDWIHTPGSDLFFVFNTSYHFADGEDMLFDPRGDVIVNDRVGVAKLTYLLVL